MIKLLESTYHEMRENYQGICKDCYAVNDSCEPDAENYQCEECGESKVDGIELFICRGEIDFVESEGEQNIIW